MTSTELTQAVEDLNYLSARISKYLKNNQYVYLRAFDSWQESYNQIAGELNSRKLLSAPLFTLSIRDYSPSGKSVKQDSVGKFCKTISHLLARLEDKISVLEQARKEQQAKTAALEVFFPRDGEGKPIVPPSAENRVFVSIPAGEADLQLFWQGIQPALEMQGLSFFRADRPLLDDVALCELCQELHSCRLAIFNLSGQAPHVMLALGLAYGIAKQVVILQQQDGASLGALGNHGYLRYSNPDEIKTALSAVLPKLLAN